MFLFPHLGDRQASLGSIPNAVSHNGALRGSSPHLPLYSSVTRRPPTTQQQNNRRQRPVSCVISSDLPQQTTAARRSQGIVVVSRGPQGLFRSSSTPKVFGVAGGGGSDPFWELHQLQHRVPRFEPLRTSKMAALESCMDARPVN